MKSKLKQFKIQILVGVFFLIIIPLSYFVVQKLLNKIVDNITTKQKLQVEREIYMSNSSVMPQLKKTLEYIKENDKKIDVLKDNSDLTNTKLYGELEQIARRTGNSQVSISLPKYTPKKDQIKKKFVLKPNSSNFSYITIELVGTFNEAMNFLHALNNMQYISDVISFSIEKPKKAKGRKTKDEIEKYPKEKLLKSKFNIVFYLKDTKDFKKDKKNKDPDPSVNMKLVEQRKKIQLPQR